MCLWIVLKNSFLKNLPVVDKRLIERKFWGHSGISPVFGSYDFLLPSKVSVSNKAENKSLNVLKEQEVFLEGILDINLECYQNQRSSLTSRIVFF
jgi:hypothetical protein